MYKILEKNALPKSQFELTLELDLAFITSEETHVLEGMAKDLELPGFRKGKVPHDVIRKRMGEMALFEDAAMHALSHAIEEIFRVEKLDVIGRPIVAATKLAPGNPAVFKVTVPLFPRLSLPDYKAIAAKENKKPIPETKTEEKDIDAIVAEIVKEHQAHDGLPPARAGGAQAGKNEFTLSDETAKELGEFSSVADLRAKVTEGLSAHRKSREADKRRAELLDTIVKETRGEIPDVLIDNELLRLEADFEREITRLGSTFDAYLKEIKKDRETLREERRPDAEKRARLLLVLAEIARAEKIIAPPAEVDAEVKHILEHYKDAKEENARLFVENTILNQKTIEFLEVQK